MGGMGMGAMGMGMGGMMMQPKKSSMFSLSNVLTGVALYSMYRSLTGGFGGGGGYGGGYGQNYNNYGPREVHIYDHREHKPSDPNDLKPILGTVGLPQSVTGEKIEMPAKTMEQIVAEQPPVVMNVTVNGTTTEVEDPLPPLPFDNQPKIYFGYGYAYGYENAVVDVLSARDGRRIEVVATTTVKDQSTTEEVEAQPEEGDQTTEGSELNSSSSSTTMEEVVEN